LIYSKICYEKVILLLSSALLFGQKHIIRLLFIVAVITVIPLLITDLIVNYLWDKDFMSLNRGSDVPLHS